MIPPANSPCPALAPLLSEAGLYVNNNSLENVDTLPDDTGHDSPFLTDAQHHEELVRATVEMVCAVDAVAEPVDDDWGPSMPAKSGKKSKEQKG